MSAPQTKTDQRRILAAATQDGTLDTLLWYLVSDLGGGKSTAAGVNGILPVVRVGPDPEISQHDAHLMLELSKHYAPGMMLRLELTAIDILEASGIEWIEFGAVDLVCAGCGAVGWESCCCQPTAWRVMDEGVFAAGG